MNPDKTLLFIGHPTDAIRKAKALGLDVILIQHVTKFEPAQAELADVTFLIDYPDWGQTGPLAATARQIWGYSACVSVTDSGLEAAGRINDSYGLGGTGYQVAHTLRDKYALRRHLADHGTRTVNAELVGDRDSIATFGATHGYPLIVKPIDSAGGFGVLRVDGPQDVDQAWEAVLRMRRIGMDRGPSGIFTIADFLMEEYIHGPEFSVEAFSFGGRHIVLSVTEKLTNDAHFAELGHVVPARIDPEAEAEIVAYVTELLDVVGLVDGPSHTELRVDAHGPVVIESHNRAGGDRITDLVQAAYGFDFITYSVGWPFGLVEELTERPPAIQGAAVQFLCGPQGRITSISGVEELGNRDDVIAAETYMRAGDLVGPLQDDFDRIGLVAVTGPSNHAAYALAQELIEQSVRIEIDEAPPAAAAA